MVTPQERHVRHLGMYPDRKLTWRKHIQITVTACTSKRAKLNWMLKPSSKLSMSNKLLVHRSIIVHDTGFHLRAQLQNLGRHTRQLNAPQKPVSYLTVQSGEVATLPADDVHDDDDDDEPMTLKISA
ncbi:GH13037 [Drosophila grimshawi]|uniref:GH13037 n=1 Tax=Drosophila grimshawi TaxID=7222 RepID=B4JR82_DROGR|nr:GH13037 [Drosophila grimshawi]